MSRSASRREARDRAIDHFQDVREQLVRAMRAEAAAAGGAVTATAEVDGPCRIAIATDQAQAMDPADIATAVVQAHNRVHRLLVDQVRGAIPFLTDRPGPEVAL
jgi:hypothetical protein